METSSMALWSATINKLASQNIAFDVFIARNEIRSPVEAYPLCRGALYHHKWGPLSINVTPK